MELRPQSELIKIIQHKGKSFVPMLKLFELAFNMSYENEEDKFDFRELADVGYLAFELNRKTSLIYRDNNFYKDNIKGSTNISNQLEMFKKLNEWNFINLKLL